MIRYLRSWGVTKTTITAALIFAIGLADYLSADPFIDQFPKLDSALVAISGALMMIMRILTVGPLTMDPKDAKAKLDG